MVKHITGAAVLAALLTTPVMAAGTPAGQGAPRQQTLTARMMRARVQSGIRAGALTRAEAQRIRVALSSVRARAQAARADGQVSRAERQALRRAWRGASRMVYRLKHNDVRRP